ncbi:MAG: hypothetical protein JNN01_05935 [Opitutaceae bacterium]|nr:hypothetical protein [Opitutaceae bacterium]
MGGRLLTTQHRQIRGSADFGGVELRTAGGLTARVLPNGTLYSLRHGDTLINQLLPGPAENGLFRLVLRGPRTGGARLVIPLVGPGLRFAAEGSGAAWASCDPDGRIECTTTLQLHPSLAGWAWRIVVYNRSAGPLTFDVLHAQDVGLADTAAVRNNEAYVSQYTDFFPVMDSRWGRVLLVRQNQPMSGGRRPWAAFACAEGSVGYCTDAWQYFGFDHRLTGEPAAHRDAGLVSRRVQYESALAGLQSRLMTVPARAVTEVTFFARFLEDHPSASAAPDFDHLLALLPLEWASVPPPQILATAASSVFTSGPWIHGASPTEADWNRWFPGPRRQVERDSSDRLLSFFHGHDCHVVSREKEAAVVRPHGHILRSGVSDWVEGGHFGLTCYASGVFAAQAYCGNPNLARLLSVVRNPLNVARASGQRVWVQVEGAWRQLGVPSAFALKPGEVRWIYRFDATTEIEARVWCSATSATSFLELSIVAGGARQFLVTHQLALGANEFESGGGLVVHAEEGWMSVRPSPAGFAARHLPDTAFAIAAAEPSSVISVGGDESLWDDGADRGGPYATLVSAPVLRWGVVLIGSDRGVQSLPDRVALARREWLRDAPGARPPQAPVRLQGSRDSAVGRVDEILPWFAHNASIHFSAPHGLEQYGGAAWGVRDVCQGSVEWLLASGRFDVVRRILLEVFAQQYAPEGNWPQWFMFPPFRFIQQAHSHGDVCLWPVKALGDYVEASHDFAILAAPCGYTHPESFESCGPVESLQQHCQRVIRHVESRFVPGTALVNYGDGDWDDTLQPADPAMRTRMISAWTVGLAFHTFRQWESVLRRAGMSAPADHLAGLLTRIRADFAAVLMPGGVVAGFLVTQSDGSFRPILHPDDQVTGIRFRLLPMTRAILAHLFTPEEARRHLALVRTELSYPDGVRLMSAPSTYHGGCERLFKRAETAANVGREIGLQYVHAHLRYAQALARVGDADGLWLALQQVNPVGLQITVPQAAIRQSNVYFSSSDADFADRTEATARWPELRLGKVSVRGGWRLYSSGPGLFLRTVRAEMLGLRESFGHVIVDPVLPESLDGLTATARLCDCPVEVRYRVSGEGGGARRVTVNGVDCVPEGREDNPYRPGGLRLPVAVLDGLLKASGNRVEVDL